MSEKIKFGSFSSVDISQSKIFIVGTYSVLLVVSFVMTVMNVITHKGFLTVCTGAFAFLCLVNIILSLINSICLSIAKLIFACEILVMFTFFLVSGNPDGFSAIWICMLPSIGMMFFGRTRGTLICAIMFLVTVFFLWLPFGRNLLMYEYSSSFKMRFPVAFVAFHLVALFLETLRINAYREMRRLQKHYEEMSVMDQLTQVFNRQGMYSAIEQDIKFKKSEKVSVAIFDIDDFKTVNDSYGHNAGDQALKDFAEILKNNLDAIVCRWGGEEFVAVFCDNTVLDEELEKVRKLIEDHTIKSDDKTFAITISAGVHTFTDFCPSIIDQMIGKADEALYYAKTSGKNRIVKSDFMVKPA